MVMVKEAIEGWLEVSHEKKLLDRKENQQLVEICVLSQSQVKNYVKSLKDLAGNWQELKEVIISIPKKIFL